MASSGQAAENPKALGGRTGGPGDLLPTFAGEERILGILPFVADIESNPKWFHLLFTEDKILAVSALPEPGPDAKDLFLPHAVSATARYPSVAAALRLVAIPEPLHPSHVAAVIPYALVRRVRLSRGKGPGRLPELEIGAGRRTTWWFFQEEDETPDEENACYARDLLLSLLPFQVELVGFTEAPRPPEWHLRRGVRQPLPLLFPATSQDRVGKTDDAAPPPRPR